MSPSQVIKPDPRTPPHGNSSRKRPRDSPDSLDQSSAHDTKKRMIRHPTAPPPCLPEAKLTFGRFPVSRSIEYNRDLDHLDITGPLGFHHVRRPEHPPQTGRPLSSPSQAPVRTTAPETLSAHPAACISATAAARPEASASTPGPPTRTRISAPSSTPPSLPSIPVTHVVVKSQSSYIVEAVGGGKRGQSPYMEMWMANGFRTAQGLSIKNLDLWRDVLQRLRDVQNLGSFVEFWLVSKAENQEARELAAAGQSRRAAAEEMMASFRNAYGPFPTVKKEPK
ncbi:unnamed protein product [Colletotrichum noveboracense]|uniref:RNase H type-1 domain-containing protein n=1 Tax=Colletotrichum noveboracense TaxID=2664923 RepID=A0A9W4S7K0_9PEZI|nr:unnamed protein product [Colletotrichum noveboracense]